MDFSKEVVADKKPLLVHRRRLRDGTVITVTKGVPPKKRKRVVIASGLRGKKTIGNVMIAQLQPFKKSMARQLSRRGIYADHLQLKRIIPLYYNNFVCSEHSQYTPINMAEFVNHIAYRVSPSDNLNGDVTDFRNMAEFTKLDDVIENIIDVFRTAKNKKRAVLMSSNSYDLLTDDEQEQARTCQKVEKHLEAVAEGSQSVTKGSLKNIIMIGIVLFLLYQFMK